MAVRASSRDLPAAAEIKAAGLGIERAWRSLLHSLTPIADGAGLVRPSGGIALTRDMPPEEEAEAIRLMAFLIRPDDGLLEELRHRCGASEAYAKRAGRLPHNVHRLANPARFAKIESFVRSEPYIRFTSAHPEPGLEDYFDGVMASCPGLTWYAGAVVRRFSEQWSTVWMSNDPEEGDEDAFPLFLGFARGDGDWRAAGHVLSASEAVFGGFPDEVSGSPYLALCAISDENGFRPAEALLALDDERLEALEGWLGPFWGFGGSSLQQASDALTFLSRYAGSIGDGPQAVRRLFDLIGEPSRFSDLEMLEEALIEDRGYCRLSDRAAERRRKAARRTFLRRIARDDDPRLWENAHREEPLPPGEPLFALLRGWHLWQKEPENDPQWKHNRMLVDLGFLSEAEASQAEEARRPSMDELGFLRWALGAGGDGLLSWLRADPRAEAAEVLDAIVRISREPLAFETPVYRSNYRLTDSQRRNQRLRDIKAAVEAFEAGSARSPGLRDPSPPRAADQRT